MSTDPARSALPRERVRSLTQLRRSMLCGTRPVRSVIAMVFPKEVVTGWRALASAFVLLGMLLLKMARDV